MHFIRFFRLMALSPLIVMFPLIYFLMECISLKESRLRLITDRDYGYGVITTDFLLALGTVAALVVIALLLLGMGKGEV